MKTKTKNGKILLDSGDWRRDCRMVSQFYEIPVDEAAKLVRELEVKIRQIRNCDGCIFINEPICVFCDNLNHRFKRKPETLGDFFEKSGTFKTDPFVIRSHDGGGRYSYLTGDNKRCWSADPELARKFQTIEAANEAISKIGYGRVERLSTCQKEK